jgi:hypothetical protein
MSSIQEKAYPHLPCPLLYCPPPISPPPITPSPRAATAHPFTASKAPPAKCAPSTLTGTSACKGVGIGPAHFSQLGVPLTLLFSEVLFLLERGPFLHLLLCPLCFCGLSGRLVLSDFLGCLLFRSRLCLASCGSLRRFRCGAELAAASCAFRCASSSLRASSTFRAYLCILFENLC